MASEARVNRGGRGTAITVLALAILLLVIAGARVPTAAAQERTAQTVTDSIAGVAESRPAAEARARAATARRVRSGHYPAASSVFKFGTYLRQAGPGVEDARAHFGMDVGLGVYLNPLFGLELDVGGYNVDVPVRILGAKTKLPIEVYVLALSEVVQYRWKMGSVPAVLYAFGGPGLYMTTELSGNLLDDDELHTGGGMHAGLGAHVWMLGVEARHLWTKARIAGRDMAIDGWILTVTGGLR